MPGEHEQYEDWYDNKDLYEKIESLSADISELRLEMKETKTLIRDYNGLRKTVNSVSERIVKCEETVKGNNGSRKEYIGYIIAVISTLFLLLNYLG